MMNAPENHMVTMTAKGIEDMIGKAIAPLAAENRKLKFLLGLSLGDALDDNDPPQTADQMLDVLHAIANNHPSWKNPQIPSDLLIMAGVMAMKSHLATVKAMVEGDRPQPSEKDELSEIVSRFHSDLDNWFSRTYGEEFLSGHDGNYNAVEYLPDLDKHDALTRVAWKIRDLISYCAYVNYDWETILKEEGANRLW